MLGRLRPICLGLPETYEEPAWVGVRWRIRKRTFAHVLAVGPGHPMASARAVGSDEQVCVLTFRAPVDEIHALLAQGAPFYRPDWGDDVLGMVVGGATDWDEVGELLTESYRRLAPRKLANRVAAPAGPPEPAGPRPEPRTAAGVARGNAGPDR